MNMLHKTLEEGCRNAECECEWTSGKCVKAKMWEKDVLSRHTVFRKDLSDWQELNPMATAGLRKMLYVRSRRNAGVTENIEMKQTITGAAKDRIRDELEGRTGETDSEMEAED
ncbi:hypothetical protein BDZ97DRAFT_1873705 [Flammula alnicola]|nr:hypothetical protein BDZ97DRAFT_1873705 [Flammula alnicola]